jgi:citrate lyase beta subunit
MALHQPRRATLFVGGLALQDLPAALASGADIVCIDLEDAVPPERKAEARDAAIAATRDVRLPDGVQLIARVNGMLEDDGPADLRALLSHAPSITGLMLPKVMAPQDVQVAASMCVQDGRVLDLYAIIETCEGLEHSAAIARAHPALKALYFGGFDLSTALGCEMAWEPLLYARSRVVHAGALGGIEVIDSPYPDLDDPEGLREACAQVKALGMSGKCAKHAAQVPTIRDAFTPTATEVERARRIVELFRRDPTRPLVYEGKLVELPAIRKYERVAQAGSPLSQE